ncbi:MAG: CDP-diacylglycerol diphosphatase [Gluconacetobacter diazotrophicus]|nr:CDP-diacylglycerol diphosphatase [Gluconacetobacter diazotrophicus]
MIRRRAIRLLLGAGSALLLVLLAAIPSAVRAENRDALWQIIHGQCVPDETAHGRPAPCATVDLSGGEAHGTAVLKDRVGATQYLLIPTARITGIESPLVLLPDAANYFARAWEAGALVDDRLGHDLPRRDLSLAINSEAGRTQDQLHIHVDCVRADIRATLDRYEASIRGRWHDLPVRLRGHRYRAMRLDGDTLGDQNPFDLLARSLSDPAKQMGDHTLVLVGDEWRGEPGFILLDATSGPFSVALSPHLKLGAGSGEELQDHSCRIGRPG